MGTDPHSLFDRWFAEARLAEPNDPEAVALATVDEQGRPSVRMVLMKAHEADGFVFYTNSESRKGGELAANPAAAMLFHWKSLRRQIRIEGRVDPVDPTIADAYFASRGRESQLGAWASAQSRPLPDRADFERAYQDLAKLYEGRDVPRPAHWWGYRLVPERIEFWIDRAHRLHERRLFARAGEGWTETMLYP